MASPNVADCVDDNDHLALEPGPVWDSFEQFRLAGAKQLPAQLRDNQVGWLTVRGRKYAIMTGATFHRVYGATQDAGRLARGLHLIRQAVQLVLHSHGSDVAIEHLRDLALSTPVLEPALSRQETDLHFFPEEQADEADVLRAGEPFELDPRKVSRPTWHGRG